MLKVGLTGGVASGKSTVAELFSELGTPVIDSDKLAREVVEPGSSCLRTLTDRFGNTILAANGSLDRAALRTIIFNDPNARSFVESTLHPAIRSLSDALSDSYAREGQAFCLFDIPLLVETGQQHRFDRVLIVDVGLEIQVARLVARDNSSREEAMKIIEAQASRLERLDAATDVIINNVTLCSLASEVSYLHQKFTDLAQRQDDFGP